MMYVAVVKLSKRESLICAACHGNCTPAAILQTKMQEGKDMDKKSMIARINALRGMTAGELRTMYSEVFGEETRSGNRDWLWRRIAWRIQEMEYGGLPERAKQRAADIADISDIRKVVPKDAFDNLMADIENSKNKIGKTPKAKKKKGPSPGMLLNREYKGENYTVKVLNKGFEYDSRVFRSLSAVAKDITGSHWNGNLFFNL